MSLNVVTDPWIPVRLRDGTSRLIRPADIADFGPNGDNPPVEIDAARPDFNGALIQFLIGLVQTFAPPEDEDQWWDFFDEPPPPEELHEQLARFEEAFEVFGHPRFLQDFEDLPQKRSTNLFELLLGSPAGGTNKDLFQKHRERFPSCASCAALGLLTLQLNAPSGGRGHRTSIRGGGPVTTLLRGENLFKDVWLNILPSAEIRNFTPINGSNIAKVLPWLAQTRVSDKSGQDTLPTDTHGAQVFWATPRRLQLEPLTESDEPLRCACCGAQAHEVCTSYRDLSYGVNYTGPWVHPLTPYTFKKNNEPNSLKASPEGFAYKHWQGVISVDEDANLRPARVLQYFRSHRESIFRRSYPELQFHVWVFGYDVDNAKIRSWQEGQMPLVTVSDELRPLLDQFVRHLIKGADDADSYLRTALRRGLYGKVTEVTSRGRRKWTVDRTAAYDASLFTAAKTQFWLETEADFYDLLGNSAALLDDSEALAELKQRFARTLSTTALSLFDRTTGYGNFHGPNPKSLALARNDLRWFFNTTRNKQGILKSLDLPLPKPQESTHD